VRTLVTGGAGFIGSHLVDSLVADGAEVHVLDDLSTGSRRNLAMALARGARLHVADVTDGTAVATVARDVRPDVVFHLAAQIDVRRSVCEPAADAWVNVAGTATVLEAARQAGARRVVLASTAATYGDPECVPITEQTATRPTSPYGVSKLAAEAYMRLYERVHGVSTAALRLANAYGPRQDPHGEAGVVAIFCDAAATGRTATIFGDGLQTRDYIYVADLVAAFRAAGESTATGVFNIGTGEETTLLALAREVGVRTSHAPPRAGEIVRSCLDPSRARRELGWSAEFSLADGLGNTLQAAA
jgi:UDP-glucose 4-epimerase